MPVYDAGPYLEESIPSVLRQSFRDFELLVVDDGSRDDTLERAAGFAERDSRVRILPGDHRGISATLNRGLEAARAELVARMDADDVCMPERLARQVEHLRVHPDVVSVGSWVEMIDHHGLILEIRRWPLEHEAIEAALLSGRNGCTHPAVTFRREAVLAAGGYRPEFDFAEDYDLWLRLVEHGRMGNLPLVLLRYRKHLQSICSNRQEAQLPLVLAALREAYGRRGLEPPPDLPSRVAALPPRTRILRHLAKRAIQAGHPEAAAEYTREVLRRDPWSIDSRRTLLRLLRRPGLALRGIASLRSRGAAVKRTPPSELAGASER
jgi:GT2 family glycosyltransferase